MKAVLNILRTLYRNFQYLCILSCFQRIIMAFSSIGKINKRIMIPFNCCPNYLHLFKRSMQTSIKTWWKMNFYHHTPIFDDFNWSHLFWVFPVFEANEKVWFPGEAIRGRNICSDYKCSVRLCVWLYSQQLFSIYSKYFLWHFKSNHGNLQKINIYI